MLEYNRKKRGKPGNAPAADDKYHIRTFTLADKEQVERLSHEGLLPGHVEYDARALEHIEQTYLQSPREHFWVAELDGKIIGMLAIAQHGRDVGLLHWLRVAPPWQPDRQVARQLLRVAADHAREVGFLKLLIHVPAEAQSRITSYFKRLGFVFSKSTDIAGRNVLQFYLNLYETPTGQ